MDRRKLSSDKTYFIKKIFPIIVTLFVVVFGIFIVVDEFYILVPILPLFLIGLIITFLRNRKIVDCYVNYDTDEIVVDNLSGKILHYKFIDILSARHKQFKSEVRLKFKDGNSFIFISRNVWKLPMIEEWDNVDADLNRILGNRLVDSI